VAILIDTSVFVGLERRGLPFRDIFQLVLGTEVIATSVMTISELLAGAHLGHPAERRHLREARVEELVQIISLLDFNLEAARLHSLIWAELRESGLMIGPNDLIIAATALANGYELLTDDVGHFERIQGLTIRQPWWP
jgi:tRNA(fMet)-specific endonuclease VapC